MFHGMGKSLIALPLAGPGRTPASDITKPRYPTWLFPKLHFDRRSVSLMTRYACNTCANLRSPSKLRLGRECHLGSTRQKSPGAVLVASSSGTETLLRRWRIRTSTSHICRRRLAWHRLFYFWQQNSSRSEGIHARDTKSFHKLLPVTSFSASSSSAVRSTYSSWFVY